MTAACPRCSAPMQPMPIAPIDECTACHGVFVDQPTVQQIIDGAIAAEALLAALPRAELRMTVAPGQKMYLPCPVCSELMNRKLFAAGLVIDVCRAHGTFFDIGELPAMIDFVLSGGLARAQQKQREQKQREQARRERARARDDTDLGRRLMQPVRPRDASAALVELFVDLFF